MSVSLAAPPYTGPIGAPVEKAVVAQAEKSDGAQAGDDQNMEPMTGGYYHDFMKLGVEEQKTLQAAEISRLEGCKEDAEKIQGSDNRSTANRNFEQSAVLVKYHIDGIEHPKSHDTFFVLSQAAENLNVSTTLINNFKDWDGIGDPRNQPVDSDDGDDSSEYFPPESFNYPPPPEAIVKLYEKATPDIILLQSNPNNIEACERIEKINDEITGMPTNEMTEDSIRRIALESFIRIFKDILDIRERSINGKAKEGDKDAKMIINQYNDYVKTHYYPQEWLLSEPEQKPTVNNGTIYPWPTVLMRDGGRIVGVRKAGFGSFRLTVEREINGKMILTQEAISDVEINTSDIENHLRNEKLVNLADSNRPGKWTKNDRSRVVEVLKCSKAVRRGFYNRSPTADCIVQFKDRIHLLTVSNLTNVLGKKGARAAIEQVCERDGFAPPWDAPVEPRQRGLAKFTQRFSSNGTSNQSMDNNGNGEALRKENEKLKNDMESLRTKMETMEKTMKETVEKAIAESMEKIMQQMMGKTTNGTK